MENISRHDTEDHKGYAIVGFNNETQKYEVKFYDEEKHLYYTENKQGLSEAQFYADQWSMGHVNLFEAAQQEMYFMG